MRTSIIIKRDKEKIKNYIDEGIIPQSLITKIVYAENNEDLINALCELYNLSKENKMLLWYHTITSVWDNNDIQTCFNEQECIFFKELIESKGFIKKTHCKKIKVIGTDFKISRTAQNLAEMGLIDIFTLSNREIVYVLNLKYYKEVLKNAKKI